MRNIFNYVIVSGIYGASVFFKNKENNSIGNTVNINNKLNKFIGNPDRIVITLKGKFFIQTEGGYVGKIKKETKKAFLQTLAIWITAIGTGLGGLYLLGKAILWLHNFFHF